MTYAHPMTHTRHRADDLDPFEPEDPAEAARLDAEAEAQVPTGEYVPHERMGPWILAFAQALREGKPLPPRPKTEAQLARERA